MSASNSVEFDGINEHAALDSFTPPPKQWMESTAAIGVISKAVHDDLPQLNRDELSRFGDVRCRQQAVDLHRTTREYKHHQRLNARDLGHTALSEGKGDVGLMRKKRL